MNDGTLHQSKYQRFVLDEPVMIMAGEVLLINTGFDALTVSALSPDGSIEELGVKATEIKGAAPSAPPGTFPIVSDRKAILKSVLVSTVVSIQFKEEK